MTPRNDERAAATALPKSPAKETAPPIVRPPRYRRNAHKAHAAEHRRDFLALAPTPDTPGPDAGAGESSPKGAPAAAPGLGVGGGASLLLAPGSTPRDAWVAWLGPLFAENGSCYFTGTYSDDYGLPNGLMLQRNVLKDFVRFLESFDYQGRFIVAVEKHLYRDILHLHAILEGPMTEEQMLWVKRYWAAKRGHARALPVLDGCASYVTKYALKADSDAFEWRLS